MLLISRRMVLSTESSDEHLKYLYKFELEEYEDLINCYLFFSRISWNFEANYKATLPMAGVFVNSQ